MIERQSLVLTQKSEDSTYNDFVGKFYHFPKKYLNLLSQENVDFIYYKPDKNKGLYFGYGKIGKVFSDRKEEDHYFVEIREYYPFSNPVSFYRNDGEPWEVSPYYNAQNAVRKISSETVDAISLDGGIQLSFRADAHLIKVLGEELIANERVGILELVKNSYDAAASECIVRIEEIPGLPSLNNNFDGEASGPLITITDNGRGMTREIIENGWLRPASILKTNVKEEIKRQRQSALDAGSLGVFNSFVSELKKANSGRIPLGEKGVGRFAAHRLGRFLEVTTKRVDEEYEYFFAIDWDDFDNSSSIHKDLSKISVGLFRRPPSRDYGPAKCGSRIKIWGGKPGFSLEKNDILDLRDSIDILKSPYRGAENFEVKLEVPQIQDDIVSSPIHARFLPSFEFAGIVNSDGIADFELSFNPPASVPLPAETFKEKKFDLRKMDAGFWSSKDKSEISRIPTCGQFYLGIKVWYRKSPWIEGPESKQMKDYLDNYGGVSVFRDGINILPASWGSKHDWLELSTRHIKKGLNISYYSFLEACDIDQTNNCLLIDKTDRQGLLENQAFKDLSKLVQGVVLLIENHYKAKRDAADELLNGVVRDPKTVIGIARDSATILDVLKRKYDFNTDDYNLFPDIGSGDEKQKRIVNLTSSLRNLQKSISALEEVQELLTEQAGYGLAVSVSVHEIAKIASNFYNGISKIIKSGSVDVFALEKLKDSSQSLKSELRRFGPLRAIRNDKPAEFNISRSIEFINDVFESTFRKNKIIAEIEIDNDFQLCARYGVINQILNNLIDNSCYWLLQETTEKRKIFIKAKSNRTLIIADSGPDIDSSIRPYLFQPGYSLRIPPSGLGLYISKYYLASMQGSIYELSMPNRIEGYKGAQFVLDFSRVPEFKENI